MGGRKGERGRGFIFDRERDERKGRKKQST